MPMTDSITGIMYINIFACFFGIFDFVRQKIKNQEKEKSSFSSLSRVLKLHHV